MTSNIESQSEPGLDPLPLKNRVAFVTGSSRGIGRGIAASLAKAGAAVIVNGSRESEALSEAQAEVARFGGDCLALAGDVGDRQQVEDMITKTIDHFGQLDILVNNAAIFEFTPFFDLEADTFRDVIRVNLEGPFHSSQIAARHMVEQEIKGRIIMIGSVSAHVAQMGKVHYGAAKAGMEMMTKNMALELGPHGITVNCVVPGGPVLSDMTKHVLEIPDYEEKIRERIPVGRMGLPEDVGGLVRFLATDEGAFIHGTIIIIDGGMTLARE